MLLLNEPAVDNTTKIIDAALKGVQVVSEKLGVASSGVWDILVSQGYLNLIRNIGVIVILPISVLLIWKYTAQLFKEVKTRGYGEEKTEYFEVNGFVMIPIVWTIISLVIFVITLSSLQTPQMYAVSTLIDAIKSVK